MDMAKFQRDLPSLDAKGEAREAGKGDKIQAELKKIRCRFSSRKDRSRP